MGGAMRELVLASNNAGKLAELQMLFAPLGWQLRPQSDFDVPEADEPFHTFVENALAKARHAAALTGLPAVADDAGLCVDAFDGLPGVQTAHYATQFGYPKGDAGCVGVVLEQLEGFGQRRAPLVSSLVAVRTAKDPGPLIAVGRAVGEITTAPKGSHGFGFDPVMFLPELGQTFAELDPEVKNQYSHRGRAARQLVALMQAQWA